jgi:hypothetical protein
LLTGTKADGSVRLSPKIWFMCGSDWSESIVRREISGLTWMGNWGLGDRIEVGPKAAMLLADESITLPSELKLDHGIRLPDGSLLHLNVASRVTNSALGLMCSVAVVKDSKPTYHGMSRIGGVLSIRQKNGEVLQVGVAAAHSILDHFLTSGTSAEPPTRPTKSWKRTARKGTRSVKSPAKNIESEERVASLGKVSQSDVNEARWEPIKELHSMNWLGGGWDAVSEFQFPFKVSDPERLTIDADFALLRLPTEAKNRLIGFEGSFEITDILRDSGLRNGPVRIILDSSTLVEATLLEETPDLYLRGRHFPTRKLQLRRPIAPGTSGCWVIQDAKLCGMIVAGYETEPFAHMITAEKLVRDIEKT